jgi:hypothetical protein
MRRRESEGPMAGCGSRILAQKHRPDAIVMNSITKLRVNGKSSRMKLR